MTSVLNNSTTDYNHSPSANARPGLTAEALAQLPAPGPNIPPNPNADIVAPWCICFPSILERWFKLRLADELLQSPGVTSASEVDIEKSIPVFDVSLNELSGAVLSKKNP